MEEPGTKKRRVTFADETEEVLGCLRSMLRKQADADHTLVGVQFNDWGFTFRSRHHFTFRGLTRFVKMSGNLVFWQFTVEVLYTGRVFRF